jgi:GNAT superfamily N-acetyltransferase
MRRHTNQLKEINQIQLTESQSRANAIMNDESEERARVEVRLASVSDEMVLARLRYDFRSSIQQVREDAEVFVQRCRLWMQERLQDGSPWKCWIAEREQTAVGNLWAQLIEKIPNPTSEPEYHLYFTSFYVRSDCRGNGIGSTLFAAALAWAQTQSVHVAILWPTKGSVAFYLRQGFSMSTDLMELKIKDGNTNDQE